MASSTKKSGKASIAKKHASAKQAVKKNHKKGDNKAKNEQLLDLLDKKAVNTIQEASSVRPPMVFRDNLTSFPCRR